jgi:hypothetical protein
MVGLMDGAPAEFGGLGEVGGAADEESDGEHVVEDALILGGGEAGDEQADLQLW